MSPLTRTFVFALMLAIALSAGNMAVADPLTSEDSSFGIGSITRDPNMGLDWLDLTESVNRSFNDVNSQFGAGGDFESFHHASDADVITFFANAGITLINDTTSPANSAPVLALLALWGSLASNSVPQEFSLAVTSDLGVFANSHSAALLICQGSITPTCGGFTQASQLDNSFSLATGHALVRATPPPVPEPATSVLLLSGMVMVGLAKRKRAREKRRSSHL